MQWESEQTRETGLLGRFQKVVGICAGHPSKL